MNKVAVLDTDIMVHLLKSQEFNLVTAFFTPLYMDKYNHDIEFENHRSSGGSMLIKPPEVEVFSDWRLKDMGRFNKYQSELHDLELVFKPDKGEAHATALALAIGAQILLTDDQKSAGPWLTLNRSTGYEGIVAISSFDLIFLHVLCGNINADDVIRRYESHCAHAFENPPSFKKRANAFMNEILHPTAAQHVKDWFDYWRKLYDVKDKDVVDFLHSMRKIIKSA